VHLLIDADAENFLKGLDRLAGIAADEIENAATGISEHLRIGV